MVRLSLPIPKNDAQQPCSSGCSGYRVHRGRRELGRMIALRLKSEDCSTCGYSRDILAVIASSLQR